MTIANYTAAKTAESSCSIVINETARYHSVSGCALFFSFVGRLPSR